MSLPFFSIPHNVSNNFLCWFLFQIETEKLLAQLVETEMNKRLVSRVNCL